MSILQANCPSCAAPLEFKSGSTVVLVCPFCRSAVARNDRNVEDLGKVAEIAESESPLKIGLKGAWNENRFELTGRAQLRHELGGVWDEWYATFSNGWVGWLAEAQGKFYLTFYHPLPEGVSVPPFKSLQLGQTVSEIPSETPLVVTEKGTATAIAADGEIPYKLTPNERGDYADLSGKGGAFGTIDYSTNPPFAFVGRVVTLGEIGLAGAKPAERQARKVSAVAMGCPNCGGALDLIAPDKTERVTCPFCNSLLDVNQGNLTFLHALNPSSSDNFVLPIGAEGTFANDRKMKIIGAVVRSVAIEGEKYFWHEYLLYNASIGFRWLLHSDNHWNFVETINAADVAESKTALGGFSITPAGGAPVIYNGEGAAKGKKFRIFQDAPAVVEYVKGEFYWRVEVGETVRAVDYVSPPFMLSLEQTQNEMNWSLGTYMTNAEVEKAFGISDLPKPWNVAPNQPFTGGFYLKAGLGMLGLLCLIALLMIPFGGFRDTVLSETVTLSASANPSAPQTVFSQPFELKKNRNVKISASAPVSNSAADLDIDLVNEQSQEVESVNVPISYYQGVEDGESWSEGSPNSSATISSLPAGKYTLRVEGSLEGVAQPLPIAVKIEQNVSRGVNFWLSFVLLSLLPIWAGIRQLIFESRRWGESMFHGSSSSDGEE